MMNDNDNVNASELTKRRIKLELAYDGSDFHGWQVQQDTAITKTQPRSRPLPTVQGCIETALERLLHHPVRILGSGRTDKGVHALKQVATFSTTRDYKPEIICTALNAFLPPTIRIWNAVEVPLSFHPIRDVIGKRYRYIIDDAWTPFPFLRQYVWQCQKKLDVDLMREAASQLLGTHDFAAFQTSGSPRDTTVRTVSGIKVERTENFGVWQTASNRSLIVFEIEADGFLYNMVRTIVGTLSKISAVTKQNNITTRTEKIQRMQTILNSRDRTQAGVTAPPHGLYMLDVKY
ncbi:MAG: tRNA pseudouridine(38-40) synthase TruA [Planctomycetaceae bacterium]|jgi:tRNA pseudouridine38-40 synthase|nr:tRNA pseudouridine(38-40) synthase TruA [Planctomycetaceae bacterium]